MGGGVSPYEWILPPVAATHLVVDQAARNTGKQFGLNPDDIPSTPGSHAEKVQTAHANQDAAAATNKSTAAQLALDATTAREQDLAARTETPQEALDARRRAQAASQTLAGGQRRASQTLTASGQTLSGSY